MSITVIVAFTFFIIFIDISENQNMIKAMQGYMLVEKNKILAFLQLFGNSKANFRSLR